MVWISPNQQLLYFNFACLAYSPFIIKTVHLITNSTCFSFLETNSHQTNVQLIRKFNNWEYSWWKSLNPRMPWFDATGTHNMALLTTSSSPTSYPSGSIIWGGVDRHPADWIWDGGMRDPGVIWYWVNEDDCDADRKSGGGKTFLQTIMSISVIIV